MSRNKRWWGLGAAVCLLAVVLRAWGLADVGLWHDEAVAHFYGMKDPAWILEHTAGYINHPPLFFLLLHGWLSIVPAFDPTAVEWLNVLIGTATVGVVFAWGRGWEGGAAGLAAGFLALNPFHIYYSGELRMYALATFGLVVAGYFAVRLLDSPHRTDYLGWALAALVSIYTHSFTLVPIGLMAIYLGWHGWKRDRFSAFFRMIAGVAVIYAPWGWFVFQQARRITTDYWLADFHGWYIGNLLLWIGGWIGPRVLDPVNIVLIIVIIAGAIIPLGLSLSFRDQSPVKMLWFICGGTLAVVVTISLWGQSVFLYRTFVVLVPFVLLLVARGYSVFPRAVAIGLCLFYVAGLGMETYRLKANPPHQYARAVSEWIEQEYRKGEIILHGHHFTFYPAYFYHRRAYPEYLLGGESAPDHLVARSRLEQLRFRSDLLVIWPASHQPPLPDHWIQSGEDLGTRRWSGRSFRMIRLHKQNGNL